MPDFKLVTTTFTVRIAQTLLDKINGVTDEGVASVSIPNMNVGSTIGTTLDSPTRTIWSGEVTIHKTGNDYHYNISNSNSLHDEDVRTVVGDHLDNVVRILNHKSLN
jgi:hypothetical protein